MFEKKSKETTNVTQETKRKLSVIESMAQLLDNGYDVRVCNIITSGGGATWDPVREISRLPEEQAQRMVQTFANVVIANTVGGDGEPDRFWELAEMNLLRALTLYILKDEWRDEEYKTLDEVQRLLTDIDSCELDMMFDMLPQSHPAKKSWAIHSKAGQLVKNSIVMGLGLRIQEFQAKIDLNLESIHNTNFASPGDRKTAILLVIPDSYGVPSVLPSVLLPINE